MEREERYVVLKIKDINFFLSTDEKAELQLMVDKLKAYRKATNRGNLEAVVVEKDWPEYERVWKMIEARVDQIDAYKGHSSLAEMVSTHIENWRLALTALKHCQVSGEDCAYLDHELKALRDIEAAVKAEKN